ncbi:MAG: hypothetical protein ND807_10090 [Vicinamibacterales bacterium]|nr:hypothetical protein [Vicinamibacterales bacterium]
MGVDSRLPVAIALLLAASPALTAQQRTPSPSDLPSAPAALTVPLPFGPPPGTVDLYQRPGHSHMPPVRPRPLPVPGGIFGSWYEPAPYAPVSNEPPALAQAALRFETHPSTAQVFVDGSYVGIVEDFGLRGRPLDVTAGSHHVELRAAGYVAAAFDVSVALDQILRYRGDLEPLSIAPPAVTLAPAAPAASRTYYIIPNCYAGDRPPTRALPQGCSVEHLRRISR